MKEERGISLIEALVTVALVGLALAVTLPALSSIRDAGRVGAGARHVAGLFGRMRWSSVATRRSHGLFFELQSARWQWREVEDGNGNGLRTAEVSSGTDRTTSGPHRLEEFVEGVRLGLPPGGPFPEAPPGTGTLDAASDPVQFGRSDLVSFSSVGSASSGTIYVTDGHAGLAAVVLFGPTARIRVWRFDPSERRWKR